MVNYTVNVDIEVEANNPLVAEEVVIGDLETCTNIIAYDIKEVRELV